ncbi:hypothetical protein P8815_18135 [Bacillus altitudinis]|uniref:hypothetical protein n=1 Tax=Bacillus TaxID=1386 RepID=UPI000309ACC3|nr:MULTISPECIES: hypothetical protein [Bacillus]MEC0473660.1 hypothetical protein [Bacillus altitudinis]
MSRLLISKNEFEKMKKHFIENCYASPHPREMGRDVRFAEFANDKDIILKNGSFNLIISNDYKKEESTIITAIEMNHHVMASEDFKFDSLDKYYEKMDECKALLSKENGTIQVLDWIKGMRGQMKSDVTRLEKGHFYKEGNKVDRVTKTTTLISEHITLQDLKEKGYKTINLNQAEVTTYNPFNIDLIKDTKVKAIIHNFLKESMQYTVAELLADDSDYTVRLIMTDLLKKLAKKDDDADLNGAETALFFILIKDRSKVDEEHGYSNELVNSFKDVLKDKE